jgi:hypothetical protein
VDLVLADCEKELDALAAQLAAAREALRADNSHDCLRGFGEDGPCLVCAFVSSPAAAAEALLEREPARGLADGRKLRCHHAAEHVCEELFRDLGDYCDACARGKP